MIAKMSQYHDLSLQELEAELRNAYVKKVLECQIREKEAEREFAKIRENYNDNLEKWKNLKITTEEKTRKEASSREREIYRKALEKQIVSKEELKKKVDEEARTERKKLEEADRIVEENDARSKMEKKQKMMEIVSRDKIIFEEMRTIRERISRDTEAELIRESEKYQREIEQRSLELKKLRREQRERREKLIEKVAKLLIDIEAEKNFERESKMRDSIAEEIAWEIVVQEREEELRRKKMRENLKKGLEEQMKFSAECSRRNRELDKEFSENLMRRIMEDEKVEKLTQEARKRSKIIYQHDLIKLMQERETIRRKEIERIKDEFEREKEIEKIERIEILDARREILLKHAKNVAPYVRDNLLTEEERKLIKGSFKK